MHTYKRGTNQQIVLIAERKGNAAFRPRLRITYGLKSRFQRLRERGMLTSGELAQRFGVCPTTVNHLGQQGILKRHAYDSDHRYLYEPPGDVTFIKGAGSRYGGRPPQLIPVPPTAQGAL